MPMWYVLWRHLTWQCVQSCLPSYTGRGVMRVTVYIMTSYSYSSSYMILNWHAGTENGRWITWRPTSTASPALVTHSAKTDHQPAHAHHNYIAIVWLPCRILLHAEHDLGPIINNNIYSGTYLPTYLHNSYSIKGLFPSQLKAWAKCIHAWSLL